MVTGVPRREARQTLDASPAPSPQRCEGTGPLPEAQVYLTPHLQCSFIIDGDAG